MTSATNWLRQGHRLARRPLAVTVALGELSGILLILQTALLVQIGNGVMFASRGLSELTPFFIALPAVIAVRVLAAWGSRRSAFECASRVKRAVRAELVSHIRDLGPIALAGMRTGEIANTAVDAVEALEPYYAKYLPQRALSTLLPFTVLAVVFPLDWISGLVLVLTAVFLPVSMIVIGEEAHARNQRMWAGLARMSGRFLDVLRGLSTVRMFGASLREAQEIARVSDEHRTLTMSVLRIAFLSSFMLELLSALSIAIVAVLSGFRLLAGTMQFAPGYFILLIAPEYFLTLRMLGTFYHARMEAMSAAEHVTNFLETTGMQASTPIVAAEVKSAPAEPACSISFDSVSFLFNGRPVLSSASFSIFPGEHVALAGASGCGKSTILNLLLGFLTPNEGSVRVDGKELALLDRQSWLEQVAWLPQSPTIFHGTLRENIRLGRPAASEEDVREAIRLSCVDEFLKRLPAGLDTVLGESGQGISAGQIQRVALARLFLRSPRVVLLDEPTAHLDSVSAELVNAGVQALGRGHTMLLVTHHGAPSVDRMLFLEGGTVRARQ